jgi:hypothetical protein
MRRAVALCLLLALLGGCEKSFDDRYAQAQKKLGEQALSIDRELAAKASEAALAPEATAVATALPTSAAMR